jgi:hypothetical protein
MVVSFLALFSQLQRKTLLLPICLLAMQTVKPQTNDRESTKQRLIKTIAASKTVESSCGGYACTCGRVPLLVKQKDSLFGICTDDEIKDFAQHHSYTLRSYAYAHLLVKDDAWGLGMVEKYLPDTTRVEYARFFDENVSFNEFVIINYLQVLYLKYYYGRSGTAWFWPEHERFTYWYPKPDRMLYRKKIIEVETLLAAHGWVLHQGRLRQKTMIPHNPSNL